MFKKTAILLFSFLLLSGCGLIRKQDPQPAQTQVTLVEDLNKAIDDLDQIQKTQDDVTDDALVTD